MQLNSNISAISFRLCSSPPMPNLRFITFCSLSVSFSNAAPTAPTISWRSSLKDGSCVGSSNIRDISSNPRSTAPLLVLSGVICSCENKSEGITNRYSHTLRTHGIHSPFLSTGAFFRLITSPKAALLVPAARQSSATDSIPRSSIKRRIFAFLTLTSTL